MRPFIRYGNMKKALLFWTMSVCMVVTTFAAHLPDDSVIVIKKQFYEIRIHPDGFRYAVGKPDGTILLQAHSQAGLLLLHSPVVETHLVRRNDQQVVFRVRNDIGIQAMVQFTLFDHYFKLSVRYAAADSIIGSIVARTAGLTPAYGLADHAGFRTPYSTEITGYQSNYFGARSDGYSSRLVSNLVIFPKQGVACINIEPGKKIIKVTRQELAQGTYYADQMPAFYYFIGTVKQIYADYLTVRNQSGYPVYLPKYAWFGVGWEAFGALGWNTNYQTVTADVDRYLKAGFPLRWMVVGSGFWPNDDPRYFATTSFGYWDKKRYPDPKGFIDHFHAEGLKFIIGLRIAFIPNGPYTGEGLKRGYFIQRHGKPRLFKVGFPRTDCYFLDASNHQAVDWYLTLCDKWKAVGVDGYKEDLYGYEIDGLPDNKLDPVNEALMKKGVYVMGRNGYIGSPMDLQRYNDFNYNQNQDRGPVNGLAYAYSGFPYVYPDIIGGTGLTNKRFGGIEKEKLGKYLMRESQYAAVNPSMSFGYGPWNLDHPSVTQVCLQAALLHDRLHPYIYSAAVRSYRTGFPYTMTPLSLAYPQDSLTYDRENEKVRGYQWLIGDALMAIPIYGNDYAESNVRDIYLPAGKWVDYDNGKVYQGPTVLNDFAIPVDKTPLMVGGTGFVVEQRKGRLYGRIYPVDFKGETVFYDKDGKTKSTMTIDIAQFGHVMVVDKDSGKKIPVALRKFAWEFVLEPGHNYLVK